jgi:hypothetical protein
MNDADGILPLPVIGGTVAHLDRAAGDGIHRFESRHQLAGAEHLHGQAAVRHPADQVGQQVGARAEPGEVGGPGGDHSPLLQVLRDRGLGKARCRCSGGKSADTQGLDDMTTPHCVHSH